MEQDQYDFRPQINQRSKMLAHNMRQRSLHRPNSGDIAHGSRIKSHRQSDPFRGAYMKPMNQDTSPRAFKNSFQQASERKRRNEQLVGDPRHANFSSAQQDGKYVQHYPKYVQSV